MQRCDPTYLAFIKSINEPSKRSKTGKGSNGTNFQNFIQIRQDFRHAFASGVLRPVDMAPRIDAMVTAATNAILVDTKRRNINSILGQLCQDGKSKPFSTAEAMAFLWVYVGTVEEVTKRSGGPIVCPGEVNCQLEYLFRIAVSVDEEKNMPHVALLWRKVHQCHPPLAQFPSHSKIFEGAYGSVVLNAVPTPGGGMEQLFTEMSSFYGNWTRTSSFSLYHNDAEWDAGTHPVTNMQVDPVRREIDPSFLQNQPQYRSDPYFGQKISQPLNKDNITPKAISKPSSSSTFGCVDSQQKVIPVVTAERNDESIATEAKLGNVEPAASTSKQRRPSDLVQKVKPPSNMDNNSAANLPPKNTDNDFLLFLTNPGEYIRMNPTLFPSNNANWSARKILPEPPRKRNKPNNPKEDGPVPEVAQTPVDCTETMLRVDFTPEEYIDQTTASNYYAQGVKIVDGVRRVVFYHKMINPSDIKKERADIN